MKYVGLITQQQRNTRMTVVLLLLFPFIMLAIVALFFYVMYLVMSSQDPYVMPDEYIDLYLQSIPWTVGIVGLWFLIAYKSNSAMVRAATGAHPLERRDNPRIYNLVENLCMSCGMNTPQINIVASPELNAYASGIDEGSYAVTLTTGIINRLDDDELSGVIAHELTHIRNKDTRLLIVSIIFVGILGTLATIAYALLRGLLRANFYSNVNRRRDKNSGAGIAILIVGALVALVCIAIGYMFTMLTRFAISRRREYLADAGGAELTGNPLALASALRKISEAPSQMNSEREDIAQLYICNPFKTNFWNRAFSTHPPVEKRIAILEQF